MRGAFATLLGWTFWLACKPRLDCVCSSEVPEPLEEVRELELEMAAFTSDDDGYWDRLEEIESILCANHRPSEALSWFMDAMSVGSSMKTTHRQRMRIVKLFSACVNAAMHVSPDTPGQWTWVDTADKCDESAVVYQPSFVLIGAEKVRSSLESLWRASMTDGLGLLGLVSGWHDVRVRISRSPCARRASV